MTTIRQLQQRPASGAPRVVVVGAGFAGLAAVRRLARTGMQTTLIDRNIYSTFQPLLYQVATGGLTGSDVAYPARAVSRRYQAAFRHGELARIDPAARQITLADGARLGYDYLIDSIPKLHDKIINTEPGKDRERQITDLEEAKPGYAGYTRRFHQGPTRAVPDQRAGGGQ